MRKDPKFKTYIKSKTFLLNCPIKMLKFKHAKWKQYKRILKKNLTRRFFFNVTSISPKIKVLEKKKLFYKSGLLIKRQLYQLFDTAIKVNSVKKKLKRVKTKKFNSISFLCSNILNHEYNLGVLLYRLNVFSSIFESRKNIDNKKIFVNSRSVSHNYFLKRGDIISFDSTFVNINSIFKNQIKLPVFLSFIEIDFYSGHIIIVKDLKELALEDIALLNSKHFDLSKLRYILYKK